jgi:hypothetical protein
MADPCIYCQANVEEREPDHASDCPFETNVWPNSINEPIVCYDCKTDIGDTYSVDSNFIKCHDCAGVPAPT